MLTKVRIVKARILPVIMYRCEGWTIKKAEPEWTDDFELWKTLESPLDIKEIKPVNPKGNQPWILIGRTYAEAEAPILWPPDAKHWLIGENPDAWKDWGQEGKGETEYETGGWRYHLNGHEFEQTMRDSEVSTAWCAAVHGVVESDVTEKPNSIVINKCLIKEWNSSVFKFYLSKVLLWKFHGSNSLVYMVGGGGDLMSLLVLLTVYY